MSLTKELKSNFKDILIVCKDLASLHVPQASNNDLLEECYFSDVTPVALVRTYVSEECTVFIIRVTACFGR
jgi:hypothetical protein